MITKDISTLNEYCLTRNRSIIARSGKLRGFSKNGFAMESYKVVN